MFVTSLHRVRTFPQRSRLQYVGRMIQPESETGDTPSRPGQRETVWDILDSRAPFLMALTVLLLSPVGLPVGRGPIFPARVDRARFRLT
jgi:hypothetical protein